MSSITDCPKCGNTFAEGCTAECLDASIQRQIDEADDSAYRQLVEAFEDEAALLLSRASMCKQHAQLKDYSDVYTECAGRIKNVLARRIVPDLTQQSLPLDESTRAA